MDKLVTAKGAHDPYDDVHYRRDTRRDTTLCGLRVTSQVATGEVTCMRCREFARGDF
jgi:hypothetical protein